MPAPDAPPARPAWLAHATWQAMLAARADGPAGGPDAARDLVRAHYPALPQPMIEDALGCLPTSPPSPDRP